MKLRSCLLVPAACILAACTTSTGAVSNVSAPSPIIIVVTATPTATPEALTYVVVQGDTLGRIARAYGVSVQELASLNGIEDPNRISIGQVLVIPEMTGVPVEETDTPTASVSAEATATSAPTTTPSPTATPGVALTPEDTATPTMEKATATPTLTPRATVTATAVKTRTATPKATSTATPKQASATVPGRTPTFAPTATFLPTATRTPVPTATPTPAPAPTATAAQPSEGAGINLTPEDEALATAMQAAMAQYGVQRVVIADAREQGGARVAIGTLVLTKEQESQGQEVSLPLGSILSAAYRVAALSGAADDLDSMALVIASSEGNATALVGAGMADIAAFVEGNLSEAEFVRRWVVRDF